MANENNYSRQISSACNRVMKKYTDESVPIEQVLLQLAKDEYPDYEWFSGDKNTVWQGHNHAQSFTLSDSDIMPIWRREAIKLVSVYKNGELVAYEYGYGFHTSLSLEKIARAICDMRHPEGVIEEKE